MNIKSLLINSIAAFVISMKLNHFFIIMVIVFMVGISACVSQPQAKEPEMTTVKVAYQPTTTFGPLFIAKEEGFFARQGINVEFEKIPSITASLPSLISGDIAVTGGTLTPGFFNSIAKGANVRIVADKGRAIPGFCPPSALVVRRELFDKGIVRNVSDLKGRKMMGNTNPSFTMSRLLEMGNMTTDDVEIEYMEYAAGVVALRNGAVDAAILTEPYVTQSLNSGTVVMLNPVQDFHPNISLPLYYGPAFLEKNPDLGRRFMVAYLQGVKQYNLGKTERNLEILQNYTKLDRDLLNQSCWYQISEDGTLPPQPVIEYMDWAYANNQITQKLDADQVIDMSYVNYANGVLVNSTKGG